MFQVVQKKGRPKGQPFLKVTINVTIGLNLCYHQNVRKPFVR